MPNTKHPIIAHGEAYIGPIEKGSGGGPKELPHEYSEAKQRMIADIDRISQEINEKQEVFLDEKVICVRMEPKFEAKSYVPVQITADEGMRIIGGRKYSLKRKDEEPQPAKLYFVKTDDQAIRNLRLTLASGERDTNQTWKKQICSIYSMDLLEPDEKVMGFSKDWTAGTVEVVLHPLKDELKEMLTSFFETSKIPEQNVKVKTYDDGLTFISAKCDQSNIENMKYFNPLRAVHPLGRISIEPIRAAPGASAPQPPATKRKSPIIVGVFDGGADETLPLLNGFVKTHECVSEPATFECMAHGTGVCGIALYGELSDKDSSDTLPQPCVSVESFRVLPLKDRADYELYEAIDAIEDIVKKRSDIKLFNLSFGPPGAIVDDSINRFTYALDRLTYDVEEDEVNPLFCVAAGNDGDLGNPLNRIQSPSDMVNGLGVGAYTYKTDGIKARASYSCVGSGREGAKVKPDLLEFGGGISNPFVLIGLKAGELATSWGTSFSSPLTQHIIGILMAKSKNIVPHLGRTLLIHNAEIDSNLSKDEQGYGFCQNDVDEVLNCEDNKVTILYSGILHDKEIVQLPVFSPRIHQVNGLVSITWTITTVVAPYGMDPDAYTNNCIEDYFHPHAMIFSFTKKKSKSEKLNLLKDGDISKARALLEKGYVQASAPVSSPAKRSWNETDLRLNDLKWDTVIRKQKRMQGKSLFNPILTLHAMNRNGCETHEIRFFAAVTIDAPKYSGSLYDSILQTYQNLTPIEIRNVNRIMFDSV